MQTQTKAKGKGGAVLCTAYCPVCRTHWQAVLPVRVVTTAGGAGAGLPVPPAPDLRGGVGRAGGLTC